MGNELGKMRVKRFDGLTPRLVLFGWESTNSSTCRRFPPSFLFSSSLSFFHVLAASLPCITGPIGIEEQPGPLPPRVRR